MEIRRVAIAGVVAVSLSCGSSSTQAALDATLEQLVTTAVRSDHLNHVTVRVHDRRVTLTGTVQSTLELETAQRDAERVEGVLGVQNNLRIAPSS
jgi:osmotically-inducible protein OsmY